jgi:predicted TIM-barrel fold metal-dependent hydrolase
MTATSERLISADSHVRITADSVRERLSAKVAADYDAALAALAAEELELKGGQSFGLDNFELEGARDPGYWEPHARLAAMDRDGVEAEVLYSELSAFRQFHLVPDHWQEVARAFNDCMSDFAGVDPRRLVVSYQLPIIDIEYAVAEVERLAALEARSVHLPNYPTELGFPDYYDERYDPLWTALSDTSITVSQHLGNKASMWEVFRRDPTPRKGIFTSLPAMMLCENLAFWIMPGVLERFPGLKIAFVEPGITWFVYYLKQLDRMASAGSHYSFPGLKELPSTYFKRQMFLTFVGGSGLDLRHDVGVENVMWSTDFPHPATTWPHSRQAVEKAFVDVPAPERELMLSANAARVYNL